MQVMNNDLIRTTAETPFNRAENLVWALNTVHVHRGVPAKPNPCSLLHALVPNMQNSRAIYITVIAEQNSCTDVF